MNIENTQCLQKSIDYINAINFMPITSKLEKHMGWSRAHALEICELYRKFLILQKKYGQQFNLPPSEDIDEFWHMHILDTKSYRKDCQAIFGYYLDHYPYLGIDSATNFKDLEAAFAKTVELFALEFGGENIYEVRGVCAKIISFVKQMFALKPKRLLSEY